MTFDKYYYNSNNQTYFEINYNNNLLN